MKNSEAIQKALWFFRGGRGWIKGHLTDKDNDAGCLVGGLLLSQHLHPRSYSTNKEIIEVLPCTTTIANVIKEQYPDRLREEDEKEPIITIVQFNDHPYTTYPDVRQVLEKAMILEQEQE